ncbi:hypothetical protein CERSUDRAFT_114109 [Gelatoporia subvermispora B]|uniref:SH3 domain-containing protein n=1 Tax=Ceriporiopsis subvermispora (strain B) TaxID=914234 RepID=M2PM77_CERS8|nr:hypothetical protein CERSUDRAFT_114109 [Gelatoporia subvermispora B]
MAPQSRHNSSLPCLLSVSSVLLLLSNVASASLPLVDFDRMGKVGLAGAFAGLGLFDNSSSVSFDPSTATLISRNPDGSLSTLASTSSGGSILAGCALGNTFYFGGSFSSINNTSASNVASYTPSSGSFSALGSNGPSGEVRALFCDTKENKVWAGGNFDSPASAVAVWDTKSSSWSAPPFGGLTGAAAEVLSITTNASQSSIFFSGSFLTAFGNNTVPLNDTNNPNVPFSQGATPFSSSLVPVPLQNAQIEGDPSTSESGFSNIQNILCPSGADGSDQSWFGADGTQAVITVRDFMSLTARGLRLGNTFVDGRSTTGFTITTIPDNTVQTLTFVDPQNGQNQTCSNPCPLSTDSSILYQDFLFSGDLGITGFQLTLTEWQGAGPGLHIMQLLSSGAFASAISSNNGVSCFAPNPSNTSQVGDWTTKQADTNIPATTQEVLVSDVAVGTPQSQAPSFTWQPYVSAAGQYQINLLVPGCTQFQDCPLRTSVQVSVFPGGGLAPSVMTVPQDNTEDQSIQIYNGPVVPSSDSFTTTITMTLATNPVGSGQNGKYELVADRVQLVLTSANVTADANGTTVNSTSSGQRGFGFFEWPLSASSVNAASALPNASLTALDGIGLDLLQALGNGADITSSGSPSIAAVAHHSSGTIFLGGTFNLTSGSASGAANIVAFKNGALTALSNNGLNAPVTSLALDGDTLFVGGSFSDTTSASTQGKLQGVAMYDVQQNQWSSLDSGVNGAVTDLDVSNGQLLVTGNFTDVVSSGNSLGQNNVGFAAWNITNAVWVNNGGFLIGSLSFIANGTASNSQFLAGSVAASLQFGATGFAMIQNGASDIPTITPLGVELASSVSSNATASTKRRRSHLRHSARSWIPNLSVRHLFTRQSSTTLAPLPPSPAIAPAVLAGAFWTNTSSSKEVVVLGGNFSFSSGSSSGLQDVAIYDDTTGSITPLQGNQLNGVVRALLVQGDELYIGGQFSLQGANVNGFVIYDLAQQQYDVSGFQALQSGSGSSVVVRSITASPSQSDTLIIAGSFTQAGSNACRAICAFGTSSKQWSALGNGIQGEVASVDYAGNNEDIIIAAGSIALADGTPANVAAYTISNQTWAAVGSGNDLPGPVTAVTVDNGNVSSIFAAGKSADGSSSFLFFWNGKQWSNVGSSLQPATEISQLTVVPLQNTHAANGVVESDRMLWISGSLSDSSFGNASSALFDGENFIPYISSASSSGNLGVLSALIHSFSTFSFTQKHFLATGVVILISIAIAAGIVFLLVLIGILWTLFARRDDKLAKYDAADVDEDDDSSHRPSSLLAHINAATRTTILGAQGPFGVQNVGQEEGAMGAAAMAADHDPFAPDASNYVRAETPSDAIAGTMGAEEIRPAHARYSFDGAGEGELALAAGQDLEILDDKDPSWWYARDARTGQEGVVPAAYVY